jgi:CDP-diacylglycerol--glycerol-3-phosphate 3-phosphatidyltransferase
MATDRTLEYVLWVVYAHLGLIPVIVPIIVLIRGTTVDAVRSVGMQSGKTAFDQIKSPINQFLVGSRFMRALYGFTKTIAGTLLALAFALPPVGSGWFDLVYQTGLVFTWISVIICLVRGIPVLIEGYKSLT